eukprot:853310-Prymnesium_polylepis.1
MIETWLPCGTDPRGPGDVEGGGEEIHHQQGRARWCPWPQILGRASCEHRTRRGQAHRLLTQGLPLGVAV